LHRAADEVFTRLSQHDDGDVVGDAVFVDQLAYEIEVGLRCGRKTDFDFLEADFYQLFEKAQLAFHAHGFDQRLVAVAQIGAHPDGRVGNALAGPGTLGKIALERNERTVFVGRTGYHGDTYGYGWDCLTLRPPEPQ